MKGLTAAVSLALMVINLGCSRQDAEPGSETVSPALDNGSFSAELDGREIHYEVHGAGPVVMVVTNSWGFNVGGLRGLLGGLEERLTMVYFDPRGMGGSAPIQAATDMGLAAVREDFDALRRHLGLERVHALGWSNGAVNLVLLAAEHPDSIESAIFLHGAAAFTEEDGTDFAARYPEIIAAYEEYQRLAADPAVADDDKTTAMRELWLGRWFPLATSDPAGAPALFDRVFADAQFNWAYADHANREAPVFDARDRLPLIRARSLVIAGVHDTVPVAKSEELAAGLGDAELVILEGSGHFAPVEEPEAFRAAVFRFLGVDGR